MSADSDSGKTEAIFKDGAIQPFKIFPTEIWFDIIKNLDIITILRLSATNSFLNEIIKQFFAKIKDSEIKRLKTKKIVTSAVGFNKKEWISILKIKQAWEDNSREYVNCSIVDSLLKGDIVTASNLCNFYKIRYVSINYVLTHLELNLYSQSFITQVETEIDQLKHETYVVKSTTNVLIHVYALLYILVKIDCKQNCIQFQADLNEYMLELFAKKLNINKLFDTINVFYTVAYWADIAESKPITINSLIYNK